MDIKSGQFYVVGKVTGRKATMVMEKQFYHLELTTESKYPQVYDFWTQDVQVVGPEDGFAKVGAVVSVIAYCNGRKLTEYVDRSTGATKPYKYPRYTNSLRLASVAAAQVGETPATHAIPAESDGSDIPF